MSSQELLSLPAIVAHLRKLCREKRTGTLLIKNNSHLLGQISFRDGEIVSLFSQGKHGTDALPSLLNIQHGTVAFFDSKVSVNSSLPSTLDILEYLTNTAPTATRTDNGKSRSHLDRPLSNDAKKILEQMLKEFIGPIASMVCADHFGAIATLDAAIHALAKEIFTPAAAAQFRELAYKRLG
ncbi:MAG: DUF4388 domain-containing protein [Candidatus Contendobacter sp.]|nr:DUF4388 domain-containing protein [Candidatus Contendobacter sp.]MDS4060526.1 DUF4388 domain-containing protein [Candidatus Contendobacter sp.]